MKLKIVIALVAIAGTLGLAGCKPKETKLSGKVFIVTRGAENIKLGFPNSISSNESKRISAAYNETEAALNEFQRTNDLNMVKEYLFPGLLLAIREVKK